jgi:hypothetical protein
MRAGTNRTSFVGNQKGEPLQLPLRINRRIGDQGDLTKIDVSAPRPIREYRGIQHLSAACALPGIIGSDEIVIFLGKHSPPALWTFHDGLPPDI